MCQAGQEGCVTARDLSLRHDRGQVIGQSRAKSRLTMWRELVAEHYRSATRPPLTRAVSPTTVCERGRATKAAGFVGLSVGGGRATYRHELDSLGLSELRE
jgi:hypothetical protein